MSIFDKEVFTLRELCFEFKKINNDTINNIANFYLLFSSGTFDRRLLPNIQCSNGLIFRKPSKSLYFRIILQTFDLEFNKAIIRIKIEPKKYEIHLSWKDFEDKIEGYTKNDLKNFIEENLEESTNQLK